MISRWKVALISSVTLAALPSVSLHARVICSVSYRGTRVISVQALERESVLRKGSQCSDSLLSLEIVRIDSLYFSSGYLGIDVQTDTSASDCGVDVRFTVTEGEPTRVGKISVAGAEPIGEARAAGLVRPVEGERFDPFALGESLEALLGVCNESGYPYAQVWLIGFEYRRDANAVDIKVSISVGERAVIERVVFEGITKTDSSVAMRISRIDPGSVYSEKRIASARRYLSNSGYFQSVGGVRLERHSSGTVDLVIPVKEIARSNFFQGALGFSRTESNTYVLSGSIALELKNIAGTGRSVRLDWLNDGSDYSRLALKYGEPFFLGSAVSLDGELSQIIQDTTYMWNSLAIYLGYPIGSSTALVVGAAVDRNMPNSGDLIRSIRQRFRIGLTRTSTGSGGLVAYVEGVYRKSYLERNQVERDGELIYRVDGGFTTPSWSDQSVFIRLASEAVFSTGDVPLAELYPLGGATTLRGYRESQFRGERIAFVNLEYRFGERGWLFLFDDVGAFYRRGEGWTVKNGAGFGLRSESPLGIVVLSFGVGERLSLEGTRIHISLVEKF
jgi:outer membrane protein assembly factor BamA